MRCSASGMFATDNVNSCIRVIRACGRLGDVCVGRGGGGVGVCTVHKG